eukprot:m.108109 g.108109  ORF g.108109 m.108109 type:complete len:65 (+) comp15885_c0_seq2:208-402(+)
MRRSTARVRSLNRVVILFVEPRSSAPLQDAAQCGSRPRAQLVAQPLGFVGKCISLALELAVVEQ